jgi:vacuolar-type H+-ATPase subunit E/Vma4
MSQGELIEGIAQDAAAEARRLVEEAEKAAAERRQAAERQATDILGEAGRKSSEQAASLKRQAASTAKMQTKRIALRVREQAARQVLEQVRLRLARMIGAPEYRQVLLDWIVEAAIGLGLPEATVNASAPELPLLEQGLLEEAERRVRELTGREVRLSRAEGDPLAGQGVVLVGRGGRLAYNNQVSTRLLRRQTEIRKMIYDGLWTKES